MATMTRAKVLRFAALAFGMIGCGDNLDIAPPRLPGQPLVQLLAPIAGNPCRAEIASFGGVTGVTTFTYDANGREIEEASTFDDGTTETILYGWDNLGHSVYWHDTVDEDAFAFDDTYDSLGDLVDETYADQFGTSNTHYASFDGRGNPSSSLMTDTIADTDIDSADYTYDSEGRVVHIDTTIFSAPAISDVEDIDYDESTRTITSTRRAPDGVETHTTTFDEANHRLSFDKASTIPYVSPLHYDYTYGGDRLLTRVWTTREGSQTTTFVYDCPN